MQLNKNWLQDIADTVRCSYSPFTVIIFLLLIDTYLYIFCVVCLPFLFISMIVAILGIGLWKRNAIQFQYNSGWIQIWSIQYNTILELSQRSTIQYNTDPIVLYFNTIHLVLVNPAHNILSEGFMHPFW